MEFLKSSKVICALFGMFTVGGVHSEARRSFSESMWIITGAGSKWRFGEDDIV